MITAVTLQVAGVDIQDHARASLLGEHFADLLWASVDGLVTCTVYLDGGDITAQVTQVARAIEHRISGASVIRVHRDLVTQSDIASRVGVSREAVRKWTQRPTAPLFPAPFDTVGGVGRPSKVWQWAEVVPWLRDAYDLTVDDDELPDAETVAHIDACLAKVRGYLDRQWQDVPLLPDVGTTAKVIPLRVTVQMDAGLGTHGPHSPHDVDARLLGLDVDPMDAVAVGA